MKIIQIIDGADNATYSLFRVSDEEFSYLFPGEGQDLEIIEDVFARHHAPWLEAMLADIWLRPVAKPGAGGIDGTLFYDYADKRHHLPASKREIDRDPSQINQAERELYARLQAEAAAPNDEPASMTDVALLRALPGGESLLEWSEGKVPSFHDAEILSLTLDREGPTGHLRVYAYRTTSEIDDQGFFAQRAEVIVTFALQKISALEHHSFNNQNPLYDLTISRTAGGEIRLDLAPCDGLAGFIQAERMSISLEPWEEGR